MKEKNWIEGRKSLLLKELVHQMLLAKLFFEELYEDYKKSGRVSFQKLDHWIGTEVNKGSLWNLKDSSHLLFRNNTSNRFFYESVFDWTLGSIFHEGMKLKENVYLMEVYQREGHVFTNGSNIPEDVNIEGLLEEYKIIITRAQKSAEEEMENLRYLFSKGMEQLEKLIIWHKDDGLLIRFLVEAENLYDKLYGQGALKKIFEGMYDRGLVDAYLKVGGDYREGGWYSEALMILKRALELSPRNREVRKEYEKIQKVLESLK